MQPQAKKVQKTSTSTIIPVEVSGMETVDISMLNYPDGTLFLFLSDRFLISEV
jgi:hypothetical protein